MANPIAGAAPKGFDPERRIADLRELLRAMQPRVADEVFIYASVPPSEVAAHMHRDPVAIIREAEGTTLIVPISRADGLSGSSPMRMITLDVYSSLEAVGLTAAVAAALARAGVSANMVAGYHHDHILVPERDADAALASLEELARIFDGQPTE